MVTVSNAAELASALSTAQAGDTIELLGGNYGDVSIQGVAFSDFVTLVSSDPNNPAIFNELSVSNASYLRFDGIEVEHILEPGEPDWVSGMRIDQSDHIEILNSEFTGSQDGDFTNDGQGLLVLDSSDIVVSGNSFHDLKTGAGFGRSENLQVSGNSLFDIRSDGLNFGAVSHVVVENNSLTDFHPASGDHPDMIQFFNNGASQDMSDVVIRGNQLSQGTGSPVQGIFIQGVPPGEVGTYPYAATDFTIENNSIELGASQGIWVYDVADLDISGNTLTATPDAELVPAIRTERTIDASVSGNTAPAIDDIGSAGISYSGNTITGGGSSGSGTSGDDVIYGDDGDNAINSGAGADEVHGGGGDDGVFGGGGNDRIFGEAGDDTLFGDGGNDMLNGGAGNDELHGGSGNDGFYGGGGNDRIYGEAGNDTIFGDGGNDAINGGAGHDSLHGGSGNDGFFGGGGDDLIFGDAGNDTLFGDGGNDTLNGGTGLDSLYGGSGADTFVFEASGASVATVNDFSVGAGDLLQFFGTTFESEQDVLAAATQDGTTTVIEIDADTTVNLLNVSLADLSTDDFLL